MINIKSLFSNELKIGDPVTVIGNSNGNNYVIGQEYIVSAIHGNNTYSLSAPGSHFLGNMVVLSDLKFASISKDKSVVIQELENLVEFIKDCDSDISDFIKLEKEFKVFTILKEVKSARSDFEKISIISKYL